MVLMSDMKIWNWRKSFEKRFLCLLLRIVPKLYGKRGLYRASIIWVPSTLVRKFLLAIV